MHNAWAREFRPRNATILHAAVPLQCIAHGVAYMMKDLVRSSLLLVFSIEAIAGALDQFRPLTSGQQVIIYQKAIASCMAMIRDRVGNNKVNIAGPCADSNGSWKGITAIQDKLSLTFSVDDDKSFGSGELLKVFRGKSVHVTCQTDGNGRVTAFEDRKAGISDVLSMTDGLCYSPGSDNSQGRR